MAQADNGFIVGWSIFDLAEVKGPLGDNWVTQNPSYLMTGPLDYYQGYPAGTSQVYSVTAERPAEIDTIWLGGISTKDIGQSISIEIVGTVPITLTGTSQDIAGGRERYGPYPNDNLWGRKAAETIEQHDQECPPAWAMLLLDTPVVSNQVNITLTGLASRMARAKIGKRIQPETNFIVPYSTAHSGGATYDRRLNTHAARSLRIRPVRTQSVEFPRLSKAEFEDMQRMLRSSMQGFDVLWCPHPNMISNDWAVETMLTVISDASGGELRTQREPYIQDKDFFFRQTFTFGEQR